MKMQLQLTLWWKSILSCECELFLFTTFFFPLGFYCDTKESSLNFFIYRYHIFYVIVISMWALFIHYIHIVIRTINPGFYLWPSGIIPAFLEDSFIIDCVIIEFFYQVTVDILKLHFNQPSNPLIIIFRFNAFFCLSRKLY